MPAGTGARAAARLRGTLVTLAAAARSSGGTTAITYDWRAGTSICDSDDRNSRNTIVSFALGIMAASIRKALDGMCVYTIVLIRPLRAARATDTNCDNDPRRLAAKKKTPGGLGRHVEATEKPKCQQRLNDEAATERVQAEKRRQAHDYSARLC